MTTAWKALASVTLSSTDTSITFSSIDANTYTNYKLVVEGLAVAPYAVFSIRLNNNAQSVYSVTQMAALSSDGQGGGSFPNETAMGFHATGIEGGQRGMSVIDLYDAGRSTTMTSAMIQGFGYQDGNSMYVREQWSGTFGVIGSVTTVEFRIAGGGLAAGSTLNLYGLNGI